MPTNELPGLYPSIDSEKKRSDPTEYFLEKFPRELEKADTIEKLDILGTYLDKHIEKIDPNYATTNDSTTRGNKPSRLEEFASQLESIELHKRAGFIDSAIAERNYETREGLVTLIKETLPTSKRGEAQKQSLIPRLDPQWKTRERLLSAKTEVENKLKKLKENNKIEQNIAEITDDTHRAALAAIR